MGAILLFLAAMMLLAGWWLSGQRLASKPWLEVGVIEGAGQATPHPGPVAKLGLAAFMVVAGSLFALLISAYAMRAGAADWLRPELSRALWFSTGFLILASLALHMAGVAAGERRERGRARLATVGEDQDPASIGLSDPSSAPSGHLLPQGEKGGARLSSGSRIPQTAMVELRSSLVAAGVCSLGFLFCQVLAWWQIMETGALTRADPARAFFMLLTGLHGLHLIGGLVALGRTSLRAFGVGAIGRLRLSVELCALYWHFLLAVWLVLFAVLTGWSDQLIAICRGVLS